MYMVSVVLVRTENSEQIHGRLQEPGDDFVREGVALRYSSAALPVAEFHGARREGYGDRGISLLQSARNRH